MTARACIVGVGETAYVRKPGSGMSRLAVGLWRGATGLVLPEPIFPIWMYLKPFQARNLAHRNRTLLVSEKCPKDASKFASHPPRTAHNARTGAKPTQHPAKTASPQTASPGLVCVHTFM